MSTSNVTAFIAAGVSVLALVYSWLANRKADRNARKANEIQEQLLEIETEREKEKAELQSRASLVLIMERSSGGKDWRLTVGNQGNSEARNIEVTLNGTSVFDIGCVMTDAREIIVGAGNTCSWPLAVTREFRPPWQAVVTWDDDSGVRGEYTTTLTF